jgi:hypothetical protein
MVKIDAKRSKIDALWLKRTHYGQNRRKKVKNRLEKSKMKVSNKSTFSQINITHIIV